MTANPPSPEPEVLSFKRAINVGIDRFRMGERSNDPLARDWAEAVLVSDWLAELVSEALTDCLHPEFGTEWREPDGSIWQAIEAARADARRQAGEDVARAIESNIAEKESTMWQTERPGLTVAARIAREVTR